MTLPRTLPRDEWNKCRYIAEAVCLDDNGNLEIVNLIKEVAEEVWREEMNATKCCWCGYDETKYYVPPYGMVCGEMCASMVSIVKKVRF